MFRIAKIELNEVDLDKLVDAALAEDDAELGRQLDGLFDFENTIVGGIVEKVDDKAFAALAPLVRRCIQRAVARGKQRKQRRAAKDA